MKVHAAQSNAALFSEMQQDHTLALANIATATQSNRTSVALLMKKISEISIQVATFTAKLATAQSENTRVKNWYIVQPRPSTPIGRPAIRLRQIQTQTDTKICISRAEKNSTLTGNSHLTSTRWRKCTRPQPVASQ